MEFKKKGSSEKFKDGLEKLIDEDSLDKGYSLSSLLTKGHEDVLTLNNHGVNQELVMVLQADAVAHLNIENIKNQFLKRRNTE